MDQIMLDHMKLCHPEWLDELTETGELDKFVADHVERAKEEYARLVQDGVQPLQAYETSLRDHILLDFQDETEKYHFTSHRDKGPQVAEGKPNAKPASEESASEQQAGSGKKHFPVEGYIVRWDRDGLRIMATDYHSTELLLSWEYVEDLVQTARDSNPGPPD